MVLFTFYKSKQLRSPTNIFIIGLAISDLSMAALGNPLATTSGLNGSWFAGRFFCYWEGFVVYTFGLTEMYLLTAISMDRYVVIAKPLKSAMITKRVAVLGVVACFAFGVLWSIFPFFGWSSYGLEAAGIYCGLLWEDKSLSTTSYVVTISIFCFFLPFGTMIYCYYQIYMTIRNVNKNTVWDMKSRVARRNLKIERKMLKSCFLMCGVYWVCWSPYAVMSFWQSFGDPDTIPLVLTEIPAAAAKSQVVWNPIIYVATNKQFRKAFYASLPCVEWREKLIKREDVREPSSKESDFDDKTAKNDGSQTQANATSLPTAVPKAPGVSQTKDCATTSHMDELATVSSAVPSFNMGSLNKVAPAPDTVATLTTTQIVASKTGPTEVDC
ncbi:visual pigment-like receptor peropsin [Mercenaria mercenaria]|uniref:visual pigment-like receptor peropsin n=1 Tax=Mercenaria mercenaria TaxID=6596 RepID=UPI00234E6E48|nr:visual pigment-like receptor peropsin [Mercenaria mercenaria]